jgi:hypothetical protein
MVLSSEVSMAFGDLLPKNELHVLSGLNELGFHFLSKLLKLSCSSSCFSVFLSLNLLFNLLLLKLRLFDSLKLDPVTLLLDLALMRLDLRVQN